MLYIGSGDGGPGADPNRNGQRVDTLLGKLLRIDVDRRQDGLAYGIPPDNPFVGRPGARPEIWAYGLRNPWRFSFDRDTGDIWIGDVGEFLREEIDFLPARAPGVNYGWSVAEGFVPLPNRGEAQGNPPVLPVAAYAHGPGAPRKGGTKAKRCSVTGGYVYRGRDVPELSGMYLFSDWCTGEVFAMPAPPQSNPVPVAGVPPLQWVTSFGEGADAELYIVADGTVYRFAPKG
jgi:glucose/arabinose dehydrogenase